MHYSIAAGLYAVGEPTMDSEIFVSANYKLSFDVLRRELKEMDAWILVLDTKGINVWCAAGKGTFGTDELIKRILEVNLGAVVSHRRIILPQLSAVGVSAGIVQKKTEFRVSFGPVRAQDILAYVRAKCKKTPEMSTIRFSIFDRLILTQQRLQGTAHNRQNPRTGKDLAGRTEPSSFLHHRSYLGNLRQNVPGR